jgi:DNA-binding NarL/FixJ family response regulator
MGSPKRRARTPFCRKGVNVIPHVTSQFKVGVQDRPQDCNRNPHNLTQRELNVLYLLTEGLADKQIAMAMGVTVYTVNKHVGAILAKMCVSSRTAAAVRAVREHIFDSPAPASGCHPI